MNAVPFLGLVAGVLFAACGIPAALAAWRMRYVDGSLLQTALMILLGAVCMYLYLLLTYGFNWLLLANYAIEAVSWAIVSCVGLFGKDT